jgi:FkbM family methyltransferase
MKMGRDFEDFPWLYLRARTEEDRRLIREIEEDHKRVFEKGEMPQGEELFSIGLGNYRLWFRRVSAYSSIEIYTEIFRYNNHMQHPKFKGKDARVVIDAGACEGYYTLRIKEINPNCRIIAIEPNPQAFEILEKNIKTNGIEGVELVKGALHKRSGIAELEYVDYIPAISSFSLERPWLKDEWKKKHQVKLFTLSEIFERFNLDEVDILKVDVEGSEYDILSSSVELFPLIKRVVVEYHSLELRDRLIDLLSPHYSVLKIAEKEEAPFGDIYFG